MVSIDVNITDLNAWKDKLSSKWICTTKITHLKCASNFTSAYVFNLPAFPSLDCLILESLLLFK